MGPWRVLITHAGHIIVLTNCLLIMCVYSYLHYVATNYEQIVLYKSVLIVVTKNGHLVTAILCAAKESNACASKETLLFTIFATIF